MKVIKVIKFTPLVVGALLLCQCSNEEKKKKRHPRRQ